MNCLLCHSSTSSFAGDAFKCSHCGLVFKNPRAHLNTEEDLKRYSHHQNNNQDQGYINFLNKVVIPLSSFLPLTFTSIDYGCGPGPTLSLILREKGGLTRDYDPLFYPDKNLLDSKYDVVTSTEVVEHFKDPKKDWEELVSLVKPNGLLGIMTQFLNDDIDYQSWWYKNDPTHVSFYNEKTFDFLANQFNLEIIFTDKNSVIIFRKI